jgi:hypothetical protein
MRLSPTGRWRRASRLRRCRCRRRPARGSRRLAPAACRPWPDAPDGQPCARRRDVAARLARAPRPARAARGDRPARAAWSSARAIARPGAATGRSWSRPSSETAIRSSRPQRQGSACHRCWGRRDCWRGGRTHRADWASWLAGRGQWAWCLLGFACCVGAEGRQEEECARTARAAANRRHVLERWRELRQEIPEPDRSTLDARPMSQSEGLGPVGVRSRRRRRRLRRELDRAVDELAGRADHAGVTVWRSSR